MTSEEPLPGRCGARCRDGGHCENHPVDGAARCRMHGGDSPGAPEGNQHATRHGLHADPQNVLDHLAERDCAGYEWVLKKYDSYLAAAPFSDGSAKADELKQICAQEYVIWQGIDIQLRNGLVVTGSGDTDALADFEENPVNRPLNQLQRTVTRRLKDLGVLDSPDTQNTGAQDTAAAIRDLMEEADSE